MMCKTSITVGVLLLLSCLLAVEGEAPSFIVPLSTTSPVSVDENSPKDISILTVEGQDIDGETLIFSLVSQTPTSPPFSLNSISGVLKTPVRLDAEFSQTYNFTFGLSDDSTTVNSVPFTLNINDINEFPPKFWGTYSVPLSNTVRNGDQVFVANATDKDATAIVTYSLISGNSPVTFSLNSSNGKCTVSNRTHLDANSSRYYNLTIQRKLRKRLFLRNYGDLSMGMKASDGKHQISQTVIINVTGSEESFREPNGATKLKNSFGSASGVVFWQILLFFAVK